MRQNQMPGLQFNAKHRIRQRFLNDTLHLYGLFLQKQLSLINLLISLIDQKCVGFEAYQTISDAEGCESRLRCLIQGDESGIRPGLVGCRAACPHPGTHRTPCIQAEWTFRQRMTQFSAMPKTAE